MKLEITMPMVTCVRCGATAESKPWLLRRMTMPGAPDCWTIGKDNQGDEWAVEQPGLPGGWIMELTCDAYKGLCPACAEAWKGFKQDFLESRRCGNMMPGASLCCSKTFGHIGSHSCTNSNGLIAW